MLSSGLLKRGFTNIQQDEKRIINTNELVVKRIQELAVQMQKPENEGFISGLEAPALDVDALLCDEEEGVTRQSNVIKAGDEAEHILAEAKKSADELLEQAMQQAAQVEQDAKTRAEQERIQILEQAMQQGLKEGREQAAREAEEARAKLQSARIQMESEYQKRMDELEPQFVDTITGIYEHIFNVELKAYGDILVHLISTTMRKTEGTSVYLIHVSKEDFPYVREQKQQIASGVAAPGSSVEVVEDITLSQGDCLIETDSGIFDCGLDTQLSGLRKKLKLLSYENKQ